MKSPSVYLIASTAIAFALASCASKSAPEATPAASQSAASPAAAPSTISTSSVSLPSLGDDARILRESASEALASKDAEAARATVQKSLDERGGDEKRSELIDKATDAARKKAQELGKEEDLDKVRSALDDFLNKKDPES